MIIGIIKRTGICPLCKKEYNAGDLVVHDQAKSPGNSVVHFDCLIKRRRETGWFGRASKASDVVRSTEELDPPF